MRNSVHLWLCTLLSKTEARLNLPSWWFKIFHWQLSMQDCLQDLINWIWHVMDDRIAYQIFRHTACQNNNRNRQTDWWNKMQSLKIDTWVYSNLIYDKGDITNQWRSNGFLGWSMANWLILWRKICIIYRSEFYKTYLWEVILYN